MRRSGYLQSALQLVTSSSHALVAVADSATALQAPYSVSQVCMHSSAAAVKVMSPEKNSAAIARVLFFMGMASSLDKCRFSVNCRFRYIAPCIHGSRCHTPFDHWVIHERLYIPRKRYHIPEYNRLIQESQNIRQEQQEKLPEFSLLFPIPVLVLTSWGQLLARYVPASACQDHY